MRILRMVPGKAMVPWEVEAYGSLKTKWRKET